MGHGTSKDGAALSRGRPSARIHLFVLRATTFADKRHLAGETGSVCRGGRQRGVDGTRRVRFHARTRAFARLSDRPESVDCPVSGPDQTTVLETDQRHFGWARFSVAIKVDRVGAAGKDLFSLLAGRAWLRPQPIFSRSDRIVVGVHSQQPGQARTVPSCRGLEMVVGQILSRPFHTTGSRRADDSRFARRCRLLRSHERALAEPVAPNRSQWHPTGASGTQPGPLRKRATGSASASSVSDPPTLPSPARRNRPLHVSAKKYRSDLTSEHNSGRQQRTAPSRE